MTGILPKVLSQGSEYTERPWERGRCCLCHLRDYCINTISFMGTLMASAGNGLADPPHFSEPWKFSDVFLVVEDRQFHVHRNILALWSPVFEKMFASEFQEKRRHEIPLPGKKANEIHELLLMIYPNVTGKAWITE